MAPTLLLVKANEGSAGLSDAVVTAGTVGSEDPGGQPRPAEARRNICPCGTEEERLIAYRV